MYIYNMYVKQGNFDQQGNFDRSGSFVKVATVPIQECLFLLLVRLWKLRLTFGLAYLYVFKALFTS